MLEVGVDTERLFGISANASQYDYEGRRNFLAVLSRERHLFLSDTDGSRSEFVVFHGITPEILRGELESEAESIHFESFFPQSKIAIIKLPSRPHEAAQARFGTLFELKLNAMGGLDAKLLNVGAADVEGDDRVKQPDRSYLPVHLPKCRGRHWPTFVIETGYSQNSRSLHYVGNWWLSTSNGEVRTVLLISVNRKSKQVTFEKWLPGGTPHMDYRTVVSQEFGTNRVRFSNNQPLVIPFQDIFLRPMQGRKETNVTFDMNDLEDIARRVWMVQFEWNQPLVME